MVVGGSVTGSTVKDTGKENISGAFSSVVMIQDDFLTRKQVIKMFGGFMYIESSSKAVVSTYVVVLVLFMVTTVCGGGDGGCGGGGRIEERRIGPSGL